MCTLAPYTLVVVLLLVACILRPMLGRPRLWRRSGPAVGAPQGELGRRRLAWGALSELYLDTELGALDHRRISRELRKSQYSVGELEQILYLELHPLLRRNLLSVAGEWACFDLDWIQSSITGRWRPSASSRRIIFGKHLVDDEWAAVKLHLMTSSS